MTYTIRLIDGPAEGRVITVPEAPSDAEFEELGGPPLKLSMFYVEVDSWDDVPEDPDALMEMSKKVAVYLRHKEPDSLGVYLYQWVPEEN